MAEQQQDTSSPASLALTAFAASLYHAERADNTFKFLKNLSEADLAETLQELLRSVGNAIDDGDTHALARFVQQKQAEAYLPGQTVTPFRPDFPDAPFTPMRKPLREATVALFTSGGFYLKDQEPYYSSDMTYEEAVRNVRKVAERFPSLRVIPAETAEEDLRVGHVAYDIRAAQKDSNVIFPLARFRELAKEGVIGALAHRNYSYHGLTNLPRLFNESAPQWAQIL